MLVQHFNGILRTVSNMYKKQLCTVQLYTKLPGAASVARIRGCSLLKVTTEALNSITSNLVLERHGFDWFNPVLGLGNRTAYVA